MQLLGQAMAMENSVFLDTWCPIFQTNLSFTKRVHIEMHNSLRIPHCCKIFL